MRGHRPRHRSRLDGCRLCAISQLPNEFSIQPQDGWSDLSAMVRRAKAEAIHVSTCGAMDCFAEPVTDGAHSRDPLTRNDDVEASGATKRPGGQISLRDKNLSSSHAKNIPLSLSGKSALPARAVSPDERDGSRSSRTCGEMRWTRRPRLTSVAQADGEDVWSWRPDAGVKFVRSKLLRGDGGKKARSPGRARNKP
jgi:hypothetical protein